MSSLGHTMASLNPRGKHTGGAGGGPGGGRDRGQNINHLLSFTLPPRARPPPPTARRSKRHGGGQPFNKERYVAAQYRFLVKPTGDYTAYFADADIYLNWPDILSVLIPTSSALSGATTSALSAASQPSLETHEGAACPICLSPPTAPRMTKCGHVYCYPCILQYLATKDGPASAGPPPIPGAPQGASVNSGNALTGPSSRQWKRCPICWDAVYARDLKAVKWWDPKAAADGDIAQQVDSGREGGESEVLGSLETSTPAASGDKHVHAADRLRMRLMERPQITTLALPQSSTWPTSSTSPSDNPLLAQHQAPWHFQPDVMTYCKFMLATPDLLIGSLTQDLDELAAEKRLLSSFGGVQGDDTVAYVGLAEDKVREQMAKVLNELDTPAVRSAIGRAQNDLKEHHEAEKGKRLQAHENVSRRLKRQLEREQQQRDQVAAAAQPADEATAAAPSDSDASQQNPDTAPAEVSEGAEAFLAIRAQTQGGAYSGTYPGTPISEPATEASGNQAPTADDDRLAASGPTALPTGPSNAKSHHHRSRRNVNPPAPSQSSYLFYQASSGQNIYLHPLDIKLLHSQFGTYSRFPRDISVKVQGAEEGSMNEELRKRCKYLTHLPKGTDVVFVEVDWEAMAASGTGTADEKGAPKPLIERGTLKPYEQVLRARRNKRRDRERKEERAKLKAEEAESSQRPGGGPAPHRQAQRSDQYMLSQSYSSSQDGEGHSTSHHLTGGEATSPTFMEAALWGAERDFPIHPGGKAEDDFPPAAPTGASAPQPSRPGAKTVWGTPAAASSSASSFSSVLHASSRRGDQNTLWDDEADDAWHELEEGFVLGTNNSRQVRAGRGINAQRAPAPARNQAQSRRNAEDPAKGPATSQQGADLSGPSGQEKGGEESAAGAAKGGKKRNKAKLVLTAGGRGMG